MKEIQIIKNWMKRNFSVIKEIEIVLVIVIEI